MNKYSYWNEKEITHSHKACITLQELKLQGIKICDDVVISRYSRVKCVVNDLSIFGASGRALDL